MSFCVSIAAVFQRRTAVSNADAPAPPYGGCMVGGSSAGLSTLLDEELAYDATTRTRLSNHLPMALVALHGLGADDDRLAAFAASYRGRLAPVHDVEALGSFDEWRAARGRHGAYGPARAYLGARVDADGLDATLRRHLPHLVDGVSGAAFHGVIRLAYALESESGPRVAAGLAYLTEQHQPLGPRGVAAPVTDDPVVALARLRADAELRGVADTAEGNIGERMAAVARHPGFAGVADWLEVTPTTAHELTGAALALYAATDDFIALHGLTGSHALTVVAPYADDPGELAAWWFQALAAAYVTIGSPALDDPHGAIAHWLETPSSWDSIASAAAGSDDEHVVKLAYTARELDARHHDPMYRAVAARQTGLG